VRYNIHDRGHQVTIKELYEIFEELGIDKSEITLPRTDLPLLFHYGRADMTVAFFGANISPVDVQESMFEVPILVERCNTFQLSTSEDATGDKTLEIRLEAKEGMNWDAVDEHEVKMALIDQLVRINQDFRAAYAMSGAERVTVQLLQNNEGDFANNDIRIKARYLN
jgi:phenylacetate-CoA ligase